jgi:hypothetical protein
MNAEQFFQELERGAEVLKLLAGGVTQEQARQRLLPDEWTLLEVVAHLLDEEVEDFRPRLETILFQPEKRWTPIDPSGWVLQRRYNERDLQQTLPAFLEERRKSLNWLRGLESLDWETTYTAPFGLIRAGDMLAAWAAHDQLHMRQLVELRRALLARQAEPFELGYAGDW